MNLMIHHNIKNFWGLHSFKDDIVLYTYDQQ